MEAALCDNLLMLSLGIAAINPLVNGGNHFIWRSGVCAETLACFGLLSKLLLLSRISYLSLLQF
jgi:hypothetical protein